MDYYRRIAEVMLPYLRDRPLMMQRYPDGLKGESFYQKDAPDYFPPWIRRESVRKEEGRVHHVVCDNAASLAYIANQACITPHVWLSRADKLRNPDQMIFDLDPPGKDFRVVREAARALRKALEELELPPFLKSTGSRGLHVVVPLDRSADFDEVRAFAQGVADLVASRHPKRFTTEIRKASRRGRLFLDTQRNAYAQTAVAPYGVRARDGAPIAAPLTWDDLKDSGFHPRRYTLRNVFRRLGARGDPWQGMFRHARSLKAANKRLEKLLSEVGDERR